MNQSAIYRSSKRELDQAEVDFPVKRPRLHPIVAHRLVCQFLRSSNSPVSKLPVIAGASPVTNPPLIVPISPVTKPPVIAPVFPVSKPPEVTVSNSKPPAVVSREEARAIHGRQFIMKEILKKEQKYVFKGRVLNADSPTYWSRSPVQHNNLQRQARLHKEAEQEAKKRGYTQREFRICSAYLSKRDFEKLPEPMMSWDRKEFKKFLEQIRDTRGYGLTVSRPCGVEDDDPNPVSFICMMDKYKWSKKPYVRDYVKMVEEKVLGEILEKTRKTYLCAGVVNLVERDHFWSLVTFHVHEKGTDPPTDGQPHEIAEVLFVMQPISPPLRENIHLLEWKIRKGEEVLFSTVEITFRNP